MGTVLQLRQHLCWLDQKEGPDNNHLSIPVKELTFPQQCAIADLCYPLVNVQLAMYCASQTSRKVSEPLVPYPVFVQLFIPNPELLFLELHAFFRLFPKISWNCTSSLPKTFVFSQLGAANLVSILFLLSSTSLLKICNSATPRRDSYRALLGISSWLNT